MAIPAVATPAEVIPAAAAAVIPVVAAIPAEAVAAATVAATPAAAATSTAKRSCEQMARRDRRPSLRGQKKQTVAQIYTQIAEELRAQYRLGYTPDQDTAADGYHQIDLSHHQKDLLVQTRDGYYTGK